MPTLFMLMKFVPLSATSRCQTAPAVDDKPPLPLPPSLPPLPPHTLMLMKLAPLSAATAFATSVLPQPGGPYSSTPPAADRPMAAKASGCAMGWLIENDSSSRTWGENSRVCGGAGGGGGEEGAAGGREVGARGAGGAFRVWVGWWEEG